MQPAMKKLMLANYFLLDKMLLLLKKQILTILVVHFNRVHNILLFVFVPFTLLG